MMSAARDRKNYINYMEEPHKTENEREEGEIVDEYDLIVSSDEELCMRQRIRELEAENEEIEQIAVISRSYVDKISHPHHFESSRSAQVPTDVSSISSTEFVTPKKHKRRKSREHKRKHCHRQHQHEHSHHQYGQTPLYDEQQLPLKTRSKKTHCKRRQKLFAKKHKKIHSDRFIHKEVNAQSMSIESPESSDSSSLSSTDNYGYDWLALKRKGEQYNKGKPITRDTLRLAVARNTTESKLTSKKYCLKERLLWQEVGHAENKAINESYCFDAHRGIIDEDDDVQVIENEPDIQTVDEDSTDSMEEKELRLIALKSAVLKKHMARKMRNAEAAYSPTDFDEMLSAGILQNNNKLEDIDVVDLEEEDSETPCVIISPVSSPQLMILEDQEESQNMVDCKPVDMDIANSDSEDGEIGSWSKDVQHTLPKYSLESCEFSKNIQYDFYMQNLHELPPPPPGVDDYEGAPPPPPYHMEYISDNPDMDLGNEDFTNDHRMENGKMCTREGKKCTDIDDEIEYLKKEEEEDVDDEEEEALRALLLSKFQSPKNPKKIKIPQIPIEFNDNNVIIKEESELNPCNIKPTEYILKEAVKRLKVHSQPELSKEEPTVGDNCIKVNLNRDSRKEDFSVNNSDSLNVLEKLRYRLNMYQNQSESINFDQSKCDTDEYVYEQRETPTNMYNGVSKEHTESNNSEVTSTIDISDITRRLQKIKENVLNSKENALNFNCNTSSRDSPICLNSRPQVVDVVPSAEESNHSAVELGDLLNTTLSNNFIGIVPLVKDKTVKANFDTTTNQTTFKVTIKNKAAIKSEENDITNTPDDVTYKENNTNNVTENESLIKMNGNTKSKNALNSQRLVKVTAKKTESRVENGSELNKSLTGAKSITKNIKAAAPTPIYSLVRNTKIIKPNKVINATNFELNAKQISQTSEPTLVTKKLNTEENTQSSKLSDNSRLITSIDQVQHMCKIAPFLISLQNSSNESSDDECAEEYDTLYKPLYDYNDNASPLSLNLESPTRTPLRSNSPIEVSAVESIVGQVESEAITLKRKITFPQKENVVVRKTLPAQINSAIQEEKLNKTPLAVRHLPVAAQNEYRKLVHRMKLLENKRKVANIEEERIQCSSNKKNCNNLPVTTADVSKEKADGTNSTLKNSLVKKVLLRNASNNTTTSAIAKNNTQIPNGSSSSAASSSLAKPHRINVLRSYENLYIKFGAGIVNNLDKSLKLVEEAKKAKVSKLKLENRLKELKAEMEILQNKHKEEQQKISRIYPNICTTNDVITSLKQKRSKVFKAALNLGKTLKGEAYRLNNDLKETITTKSNKLAAEIKVVNSLKALDVKNIEVKVLKSNNIVTKVEENLTASKDERKIEDCEAKTKITDSVEVKLNPIETTADTMISAKRCQEDETETKNELEPVFEAEMGSNTENLENKDTKSQDNSVESGQQLDVNNKFNNACSEKDSEQTLSLASYISPLEHLRNIDSNVDPNGVICPYDLMGNCEDVTCKYVHITTTTPKAKT